MGLAPAKGTGHIGCESLYPDGNNPFGVTEASRNGSRTKRFTSPRAGEGKTMTRQEALSEARFCLRSAQSVNDPEYRSALLELAEWWNQQAEWPASSGPGPAGPKHAFERI